MVAFAGATDVVVLVVLVLVWDPLEGVLLLRSILLGCRFLLVELQNLTKGDSIQFDQVSSTDGICFVLVGVDLMTCCRRLQASDCKGVEV